LRFYFEWHPRKAEENFQKHGVSFERAATIFLDPHAISIFDKDSEDEDRWITMGMDNSGILIITIHTFSQVNVSSRNIRIISARKATKKEARQYKE